jgi:heme exporter protein A
VLEASDLNCLRGGRTLFRCLSFSLQGGELLRIAGANGSGKTSLLKILCGLLFPDSGEVRWQGTPIPRKLAGLLEGHQVGRALRKAEKHRLMLTARGLDPI